MKDSACFVDGGRFSPFKSDLTFAGCELARALVRLGGQRVQGVSLHAWRQREAQHSSRCDGPRSWDSRRSPCLHCAGPSHLALQALHPLVSARPRPARSRPRLLRA